MKKLGWSVVLLGLFAPLARGQDLSRTYSQPGVPPAEALERLNLKMAWRTFLPLDGRRDRFFSITVRDTQLLIQTRSGTIVAMDTATGAVQWVTRLGQAYAVSQPLGVNQDYVFAVNGTRLYMLERRTGRIEEEYTMPHAASAGPVADDVQVYVPAGLNRVSCYGIATQGKVAEAQVKRSEKLTSIGLQRDALGLGDDYKNEMNPFGGQPTSTRQLHHLPHLWDYLAPTRIEQTPVVTGEQILLAGVNGMFIGLDKFTRRRHFDFKAEAGVTAPIAQYAETAFLASRDFYLYALDLQSGKMAWRVLTGGPIPNRPNVNDQDVYMSAEHSGLYRLDRVTGSILWQNNLADRFVAANPKFVYALDLSNRLMVLERNRGSQLAIYEGTRDFVVPISNELTDRLFLASNDGLILCLHDRDYPLPLRMKAIFRPKSSGPGGPAPVKLDMGAKEQ